MAPAGVCASARSRRATPPTRSAARISRPSSIPDVELGRGEYYWHEVVGVAVRGTDGAELGTVRDIYRVGENDVLVVDGGTVAPFDLPVVRAFIRVFAPRRGEIVVDAESLDLRPAKSKTPDPDRPKAPRRRTRRPTTATRRPRPRRRPRTPRRWPRPPPRPTRPRRRSHDARDRRPDAVPGDVRRPARRQHPGADPGARPGRDPGPRPAGLGPRQAPLRRRRPVRRRRGHGPAAGAGRGRARRAAPARTPSRS